MATSDKHKKAKATGKQQAQQPEGEDTFVVGIGASAGGLQAMDALFSHVPVDSVAYVIVQHLSSEHRSILTELLRRHSVLEVLEAKDDMLVETNKVYVIPSDQKLTIKKNRLKLSSKSENGSTRTIDTFFKSLAADKGFRAVGVILSGTGTDGTEGVVAIKKAGGMVIVQDPGTAKFNGMPANAINTGYSDFILPPELMPQEIFNYVKVTPIADKVALLADGDAESTYTMILDMVHDRMGIDFGNYKRPTIIRRISRRMALNNLDNLTDYLDYLNLNPTEVESLSKEFLIGVTKFFRDKEAYEILESQVIPDLVSQKDKNRQLRVWVAGCSSGEEAYSIAILIREFLDREHQDMEVKIFASDIDREALDFAGKGIYPANSLTDVPEARLRKFFIKEEGKYRVSQRIRKMVIFAPHNVINDPPFSKMDLVSCRNMLIYLNPLLQKKVIEKFHYSLLLGGYMFLGSSESIGDLRSFTEVSKKWKIWRNTVPARSLSMDAFSGNDLNKHNLTTNVMQYRDINAKKQVQHNFSELLNEAMLEEQGYAAVFVDEHYDILHGVGKFKNYMDLPEQNFTFNLLKLVPPDLAINLGTLLRKAIRDKEKVAAFGVQVRHGNNLRYINVVVKPYLSDRKLYQKFILVLFNEDQPRTMLEQEDVVMLSEDYYEHKIQELELELQHTKDDLQAVVEELETSNEELQSTNEELLSSNEELQSTNEELQSLNEELHTINTEHQYKIKAFMELDDDLNNYFRSTDIGQIFVDHQLIIRKYTPAATQLINLIESDIGRSIYQISNNLQYQHLIEDVRSVIASNTTIQKEMQDRNGVWYQMRVLPYITQERKIDGAIIIFIKIHELKNMQLLHAGIFDSSPNSILTLSAIRNRSHAITDFRISILNVNAQEMLGSTGDSLVGKSLWEKWPSLLDSLFEQFVHVVETGEMLDLEHLQINKGKECWLHLVAVKFDDGLVLTLHNITERKRYEQQLLQQKEKIRLSSERFKTLFEAIPHIAWTHLPDGTVETYNHLWLEYTGNSATKLQDLRWLDIIHAEDHKRIEKEFKNALDAGNILSTQARIRRYTDGKPNWHLLQVVPIRNDSGYITLWIGTATDIQHQKDMEETNLDLRLSQQREILTAILQTQETERSRISEALHNSLGQLLYATRLNLGQLKMKEDGQKQKLNQIDKLLEESITVTREISFELTPSVLKNHGLKVAIQEMVSRLSGPGLSGPGLSGPGLSGPGLSGPGLSGPGLSGRELTITCKISGFDDRKDYLIELSLYRMVQELLNNVVKHAQATEASVVLTCKQKIVTLTVQDNGGGMAEEDLLKIKGMGLSSVQSRVELMGGTLDLASSTEGTRVSIRFGI
ncbi:CheR family methyltransferase [Pontibacter roseus]|uniref:CheR family methyltransferase n=1 Tax=Pontibacter roseus TaxID=336989 RepID=UPI00036ED682|nr:CheR family methyltransferase [Pontibacter roseus]